MSSVPVTVRRVEPQGGGGGGSVPRPLQDDVLGRDLAKARKLAWLLDAQFTVGRFRFGWDTIIGLIPEIGDTITALIGSYIIYLAWKHKLGKKVLATMIANLFFDWLVGLVPALGDLFDAFYKAHLRNLRIFEAAVAAKYPNRVD